MTLKNLVLAVALFLPLVACRTTESGETVVDWETVAIELELGAADARDAAELVTNEETKADLLKLAEYLDRAKIVLDAADLQGEEDVFALIASALDVADVLVDELDPDDAGDIRAGVLILRSALRRVDAYSGSTDAE